MQIDVDEGILGVFWSRSANNQIGHIGSAVRLTRNLGRRKPSFPAGAATAQLLSIEAASSVASSAICASTGTSVSITVAISVARSQRSVGVLPRAETPSSTSFANVLTKRRGLVV